MSNHTRNLPLILLLTLPACHTDAAKNRQVYDCATSGGPVSTCLQMRYGWREDDALLRAQRYRQDGR